MAQGNDASRPELISTAAISALPKIRIPGACFVRSAGGNSTGWMVPFGSLARMMHSSRNPPGAGVEAATAGFALDVGVVGFAGVATGDDA